MFVCRTQHKKTVYVLTQDCTAHVRLIALNMRKTRRQQKSGSMSPEVSAEQRGKV